MGITLLESMVNNSISFPKRTFWSFFWLIPLVGFTFVQFNWYIIPELSEFFGKAPETSTLRYSGVIWVPLIGYGLISANILLASNAFRKLKSFKEEGIVRGLILSQRIH